MTRLLIRDPHKGHSLREWLSLFLNRLIFLTYFTLLILGIFTFITFNLIGAMCVFFGFILVDILDRLRRD